MTKPWKNEAIRFAPKVKGVNEMKTERSGKETGWLSCMLPTRCIVSLLHLAIRCAFSNHATAKPRFNNVKTVEIVHGIVFTFCLIMLLVFTGCGGGKHPLTSTPKINLWVPSEEDIMQDPSTGESFARGILLAYAKPNASPSAVQEAANSINGRIVGQIPQIRLYQIQVNASDITSLRNLEGKLGNHPAIESVFLDTTIEVPGGEFEPVTIIEEPGEVSKADNRSFHDRGEELLPNDPEWCKDWGFPIIFSKNWYLKLIDAPKAWKIVRGSREHSKIAVIDSGFDINHIDLRDNIATVSQLAQVSNDPEWQNHGTAVAGLIAAVGDNRVGITGVCWSASLHLFGLGLIKREGKIETLRSLSLAAIISAVDSGARVINMSFGSRITDEASKAYNKAFYAPAFRYAKSHDVLLVMSAGNDNCDAAECVPKSLAEDSEFSEICLVVGACNVSGRRADYSNWGKIVEIAAPGGGLLGSIGNPMYVLAPYNGYASGGIWPFRSSAGTSFAAPLVSGTAGLLLALYPKMPAKQLKQLLIEGAKKSGKYYNDGHGNKVPILNANQSVQLISGILRSLAVLTANQTAFESAPAEVIFDGRGSTVTSPNIRFRFEFGDGSEPQVIEHVKDAIVKHVYQEHGVYTATLSLIDPSDYVVAFDSLTIFIGQTDINLVIRSKFQREVIK